MNAPRLKHVALVAAMTLAGFAAEAADKITIVIGGMDKQIYLPAKLTEQLGFFKEEGIDVELVNSRAGVDSENELIAGAVQAVVGFYDHTVDLQSKGKVITAIVQLGQTTGEVEMVSARHKGVKSAADLKGKTLGITGIGSSTDFLTQSIAARSGLKAGEFSVLAVGAGNTFIAAMKQDQIQAGMTTEPTVSRLLKTGEAAILIDLRSPEGTREALGGPYPGASLYVRADWMQANKEQAQKLANAFVKTMRWISTHSAEDITEKMPKDFLGGDRALYIKALADGKQMFTEDGRMPQGAPETVLKVLSSFSRNVQGKEKDIDLSKTFTNEFVDVALKRLGPA